jgi:hypothetical protein
MDLDELRLLREALERRSERAPEEVRPRDQEQDGEEENRADRLEVLRATAARLAACGYDVLRASASR